MVPTERSDGRVEMSGLERGSDDLVRQATTLPIGPEQSDPAFAPGLATAYQEPVDLFDTGLLVTDPLRKPGMLDLLPIY